MRYLLLLLFIITLTCAGISVVNSPFTAMFLSVLFIMATNLDGNRTYFCVTHDDTKHFSFWKFLKVIAIIVTFLVTLAAVVIFVPNRTIVAEPTMRTVPKNFI